METTPVLGRAPSRRSPSSAPWWADETIIRLAAAPQHVPPGADGKPLSRATVYRWAVAGVAGVRLRWFTPGGRGRCTTVQELRRFAEALTLVRGGDR